MVTRTRRRVPQRRLPATGYSQDQGLYFKSWQFDHDIAQQFNNFVLHEKERHSHGVRFISTRNDGGPEEETFMQLCVLNSTLGASAIPI